MHRQIPLPSTQTFRCRGAGRTSGSGVAFSYRLRTPRALCFRNSLANSPFFPLARMLPSVQDQSVYRAAETKQRQPTTRARARRRKTRIGSDSDPAPVAGFLFRQLQTAARRPCLHRYGVSSRSARLTPLRCPPTSGEKLACYRPYRSVGRRGHAGVRAQAKRILARGQDRLAHRMEDMGDDGKYEFQPLHTGPGFE